MRTPEHRSAVALAVIALVLAVGTARWEAAPTALERASDRVNTGGFGTPGAPTAVDPAAGTTVGDRPSIDLGQAGAEPGSSLLGDSPTTVVQPEIAAALDSIGRTDLTPTTPAPGTTATPGPTPTVPAAPTSTPPAAQPTSVDARGAAALASITYDWEQQLPGWEIRFHPGIDGAYGYTLTDESVIDIYVRRDQSDQLLAHVIAHEIGHAVDVTLNDGDDRDRWQAARGFEAPWWPDSRASDFATGAGDFAESFAAWQVGTASFRSQLGDPPTAEQLAVLADLAAG